MGREGVSTGMKRPQRVTYCDWLRGMATYAVVVLHMFSKVLTDHPLSELSVPMALVWTELQLVLTRWAVPAFLMVSGALLLDPRRSQDWAKQASRIARMVAVLAIFCPVYACVSAYGVSLEAIGKGFMDALTQGSWDHLWYVYAIMGLYVLTPILAEFVRGAQQTSQRTALIVLGITTLVMPTISAITGVQLTQIAWVGCPVFYYLLGSYAHRYMKLDGRVVLWGIVSLVLCMLACALAICVWGFYPGWLLRPQCPLVAVWSILVFLAVRSAVGDRQPPRPIAFASDHSLVIYLLHPIMIVVIYRRLWWMPYQTLPPVIFEVVVLAILLGTSLPLAALLKRVPGLRKVL